MEGGATLADRVDLPTSPTSLVLEGEQDIGLEYLAPSVTLLMVPRLSSVLVSIGREIGLYPLQGDNVLSPTCTHEFQVGDVSCSAALHRFNDDDDEDVGAWIASGTSAGSIAVYRLDGTSSELAALRWLNDGGKITSSPVTVLAVASSHPSLLMASHKVGSIFVYDLQLEHEAPMKVVDGSPRSALLSMPASSSPDLTAPMPHRKSIREKLLERRDTMLTSRKKPSVTAIDTADFRVIQRGKGTIRNPIRCFQLAASPITDMQFGADDQLLAVGQRSGLIAVIDMSASPPKKVALFESWFGAITCLAWGTSSDGRRLLASGSQDDLVAVYDVDRGICLAHGVGHRSWPRQVAFVGPQTVMSVGEDGNMVVWEIGQIRRRSRTDVGAGAAGPMIPMLDPFTVARIHAEPCACLAIHADVVVTLCRLGRLKLWRLQQ
ncbi:Uncharacterized protein PBTT_06398 [Plasmodiophora brassicae]|uniref:Uncharacterized protein n=1 Tax=Plasmodiophora brassicae TaxID=37360 RepID=A0A0G4IWV8_PLABS|nr:hypothetical protein PBRA_007455 [Plasmodiophora brassicae]SPQ97118.1 unnamed protein product [Plasmodiophora brassicae]